MALFFGQMPDHHRRALAAIYADVGAVDLLRALAEMVRASHPVERLAPFRRAQILRVAADIHGDDDMDMGRPLDAILVRGILFD